MLPPLPEVIIDIIIKYRLLFNLAIENEILSFLNSFDELISENITNNYNKYSLKSTKTTKIIIQFYQPEYAHYIPFVDEKLYWNYLNTNFDTISTFKLKRKIYDKDIQDFYKKEISIYYYCKANSITFIPDY